MKKILIVTSLLFVFNIQVESLICYSCFNTPNNIYPGVGPCPPSIEFSLMNIIPCDDVHNSCVLFSKKEGDIDVPVSAGCSWRRIEKTTGYVQNCQNGRCESFCDTSYCRFRWS